MFAQEAIPNCLPNHRKQPMLYPKNKEKQNMQDTYTHSPNVNQEKNSSPISSEDVWIKNQQEYIQVRRQIWIKDIVPAVKLIALAIVEHMGVGRLECFPGKKRLMQMVGMTERTFENHYREAKKLFEVETRRGRGNTSIFRARVERVTAELLQMFPVINGGKNPAKSTPFIGDKTYPNFAVFSSENPAKNEGISNTENPANFVNKTPQFLHIEENKEESINNIPPTPQRVKGRRGMAADPFGLNPINRQHEEDIWFDEDARLQVGNGFKSELLAIVGNSDELRIQLDRAAEYVGQASLPHILKAKVRGRIQTQISDRRDRDARYQRSVVEREKKQKASSYHGVYDGVL